jgi:hypothetical protein
LYDSLDKIIRAMYSVKDVAAAAFLRPGRIKNLERAELPHKEKIMQSRSRKVSEKTLTLTPPPPIQAILAVFKTKEKIMDNQLTGGKCPPPPRSSKFDVNNTTGSAAIRRFLLAAAAVLMLAGCDQVMDALKDGNTGDTDGTSGAFALVEDSIVLDNEAGTITLKFTGNIEELEDFAPLDYIKIEPAGSSSDKKVKVYSKGETVDDGDGANVRVYMELVPKGVNDNGDYEYEIKLEAVVSMAPSGTVTFAVSPADNPEPQASVRSTNADAALPAVQFSELGTDTIELDTMIEVKDKDTLASIRAGDEDFPLGEKYKQTADITISVSWTPVGTEANPFTGVYDGGGYKIFPNITSSEHFGIFGYTEGATFENVHIGEGSMTALNKKSIGGIAFWTKNTAFTNCSNAATLTAEMYAGGICDQFLGNGSINNCWNTGTINADYDAGGIARGISNYEEQCLAIVKNCYNKGAINVNRNAGGIVGSCNSPGEITACYNEGAITVVTLAPNYTEFYAGGIVGDITGNYEIEGRVYITACYNRGNVSSSATQTEHTNFKIGGITGDNTDGWVTITASYNTGAVTYTGSGSGGAVYIGGISGFSTYYSDDAIPVAPIYACYWAGGATNGIGAKEAEDEESNPSPSDCGTYKFDSAWPSTGGESGHAEWGTGDGSGSGKYWKSLGSSPSNYPRLWFEE